jgi:hypothetical protein
MLDHRRSHRAVTHLAFPQPTHPHWWEHLSIHRPHETHAPREVWTPEARALRQELPRPALTHNGLYPFNTFYERLTAAVNHASNRSSRWRS